VTEDVRAILEVLDEAWHRGVPISHVVQDRIRHNRLRLRAIRERMAKPCRPMFLVMLERARARHLSDNRRVGRLARTYASWRPTSPSRSCSEPRSFPGQSIPALGY